MLLTAISSSRKMSLKREAVKPSLSGGRSPATAWFSSSFLGTPIRSSLQPCGRSHLLLGACSAGLSPSVVHSSAALQSGPLRHRQCPCLPMGLLDFPFASRATPSPHVLPASLLLASPPSRLGPGGFQFPQATRSACPGKVSAMRAACCWWSSSFRLANSSSQQVARKVVHISCSSQ